MTQEIRANLIDLHRKRIFPASILFDEVILKITEVNEPCTGYILPGFVDAHVHIESSMLVPSEFARLAVRHGTVATVSDPHEIANVLGVEGVEYMIDDGNRVNFKFNFGAPSCVPATVFETAGATIDSTDIAALLARADIKYLAEMMNWPGVLNEDPEVMAKLQAANLAGKPVDGHAPGLMGDLAQTYISKGITTDHECFTYNEGLDKLQKGMHILIREGSAAKNFEDLINLISIDPGKIMFCSDDKHPDDLIKHHIDDLVRRALARGLDLFDILQAACVNPVNHYDLEVGLLREGDPADFIMIDNTSTSFKVLKTWINGELVATGSKVSIPRVASVVVNNFEAQPLAPDDLIVSNLKSKLAVISVRDGQLITDKATVDTSVLRGKDQVSVEQDIVKLVVYNRYQPSRPCVAFVTNFNLTRGALASTVAHDSHNIVAVGTNNLDLTQAINDLIDAKGGISYASSGKTDLLPLEVAGLMTCSDGELVASQYTRMTRFVKTELGCPLISPYMTLSFLALLVIPKLKLSDQGLFDAEKFEFIPLSSG